mgnify:CR=1 FL=1
MKYSDQQRIEKMRETTEKLLRYVEKENVLPKNGASGFYLPGRSINP